MDKKIIILLLSIFLILLFLSLYDKVLMWDENAYLANARSHLTKVNYMEGHRYPLLEFILSSLWFFTGESIFLSRLIIILFTIFTILIFYFISKEFFPERRAFLLVLLFSISSPIIMWGFRVYTDIPSLFFLLLSFYFFIKSERNKSTFFISLSGIFFALSFLTRFPMGIFVLSVSFIFLIRKNYRKLIIFLIFFLVTISPWIISNMIYYQNPIKDLQSYSSSLFPNFRNSWKQFIDFLWIVGALSFFFPFGIYSFLKKGEKYEGDSNPYFFSIFFLLTSIIFYLFFVKTKLIRYSISFLPFLFLVCYSGFLWFVSLIKKKKITIILYFLVIISIILIFNSTLSEIAYRGKCWRDGAVIKSIREMKNKKGTIISNYWPWFGFYLNRKVSPIWSRDINKLIDIYSPSYFIYNDKIGDEFNKSLLDENKNLLLEKKIVGPCDNSYIYKVRNPT